MVYDRQIGHVGHVLEPEVHVLVHEILILANLSWQAVLYGNSDHLHFIITAFVRPTHIMYTVITRLYGYGLISYMHTLIRVLSYKLHEISLQDNGRIKV